MLIVVFTAVSVAALIELVSVDAMRSTYSGREQRLRAAALGAIALAAESAQAQRLDLLKGAELQLPQTPDAQSGLRVFYVALAAEQSAGELAVEDRYAIPEAAYININFSTNEQIEAATVPGTARRIKSKPVLSSAELTQSNAEERNSTSEADISLTFHSWDPQVYIDDAQSAALPRLVLGGGATEVPGVSKAVSDAVLPLMSPDWAGKSLADAAKSLGGLSPGDLARAFDVITPVEDQFVPGRIDVMRADARTIVAATKMKLAAAERIVLERSGLSKNDASNLGFLVAKKIVEPAAFAEVTSKLTLRTMQWRVRACAVLGEQTLVVEAVVDAAGEQCRIAVVRDITHESEFMQLESQRQAAAVEQAAIAAERGEVDPVDDLQAMQTEIEPEKMALSAKSASTDPNRKKRGFAGDDVAPNAGVDTESSEISRETQEDSGSFKSSTAKKPAPRGPGRWGRWGG